MPVSSLLELPKNAWMRDETLCEWSLNEYRRFCQTTMPIHIEGSEVQHSALDIPGLDTLTSALGNTATNTSYSSPA